MKILNIALLLLLGSFLFVSCEDDDKTTINPAAETGNLSFVLNETAYSKFTYLLEEQNADSIMDALTCVQPDYGFTAAVKYTVEVAFDNTFPAGKVEMLPTTVNGEKVNVINKEINKAIAKLYGDGNFPAQDTPVDLFIRLKAVVNESTVSPLDPTLIVKPLLSNTIKMSIQPYYVVLKDADPAFYCIIGYIDWSTELANIGKTLIPLSVAPDSKYDPVTGAGEFSYTGFFDATKEFKLIGHIDNGNLDWSNQWGSADGSIENTLKKGPDEPSNIKVPTSGYYTLNLNSITNKLIIKPYESEVKEFESIQILGDFSDWDKEEVDMVKLNMPNAHVWSATITIPGDKLGVKFRANHAWGTSWGGDTFPFATVISSNNIPAKAGTYLVTFNDIDGCYYFFKQE